MFFSVTVAKSEYFGEYMQESGSAIGRAIVLILRTDLLAGDERVADQLISI